jgi:hypothetical protein
MSTNKMKVRVQGISMGYNPQNEAGAVANYNVNLIALDSAQGTGFNIIVEDLSDIMIGKDYDLNLTPSNSPTSSPSTAP